MSVRQRVFNDSGGYRERETVARMFWSGDGHNHWHVNNLQSSRIDRLPEPSQSPLRTGAEQGFCFYDTHAFNLSLPRAPGSAVYRTCGTSPSQLTITTGLSVGWSDVYPWSIAFQWIDITGLPSGRYRLTVIADPSGWFEELGGAQQHQLDRHRAQDAAKRRLGADRPARAGRVAGRRAQQRGARAFPRRARTSPRPPARRARARGAGVTLFQAPTCEVEARR